MRSALVLAGGGYVASSSEIGLITGIAEVGVDVRNADLFVGTAAGARVALDLTRGMALDEIYQRRVGTEVHALPRPAEAQESLSSDLALQVQNLSLG